MKYIVTVYLRYQEQIIDKFILRNITQEELNSGLDGFEAKFKELCGNFPKLPEDVTYILEVKPQKRRTLKKKGEEQ
ncbi:MAG TPA: hypothetical protein PKZ29_02110 [Candidatus Woesebacteria bacterium]|nr:hypothetical protein [Candidatus Woesebacteria bacterium]